MQIILAGAKLMNRGATSPAATPLRTPRFEAEARAIAADMTAYAPGQIESILKCSPSIAARAAADYRRIASGEAPLMPAMAAYNGQAYKHLKASTLSPGDWDFADSRLWILSFMYGMLRPLDGVADYRMEGGVRLPVADDATLFEFWRDRLTPLLVDSVRRDGGTLLHLATDEFQLMFDWRKVERELTVVRPRFMEPGRDGVLRTVTVHAKTCRGAMARYVLTSRADSPEGLKAFSYNGYAYNARLSSDTELIFTK